MSKRVLSGVRASGRLHLGNYLGAVSGMLDLQNSNEYETFYMVADLHALTTPFDPSELRVNRREVVRDYLACGLDPSKSVIFEQSDSYHAEFSFYLSSFMTVARMMHLPTYKDKVKQSPENASMALLNYPILMAADILAYKANAVPVGDDQLPHLEVTREIARKLNDLYGLSFPEPEQFKTKGHLVPSLTGTGKMSKSVDGSYILLTDNLDQIISKMASVPTDSGQGASVPESGGVDTLFKLVDLFLGEDRLNECKSAYLSTGVRYGDLKKEISESIYNFLKPMQDRRSQIGDDEVEKVINAGAKISREIVGSTISELRVKMGLI
jgi:tryptophanyl-tRNA synthetase